MIELFERTDSPMNRTSSRCTVTVSKLVVVNRAGCDVKRRREESLPAGEEKRREKVTDLPSCHQPQAFCFTILNDCCASFWRKCKMKLKITLSMANSFPLHL